MPTPLTDVQLYEEYNKLTSFELCMHAQEITQDAVIKLVEFINLLKATSTASLLGDQNTYLHRKIRIEETLNSFEIIFQRLRLAGTLVYQRKLDIDHKPVETPLENQQLKDNLELLKKEQSELKSEIREKNGFLKLAIDKVSEIIWQINSMQKLRQ